MIDANKLLLPKGSGRAISIHVIAREAWPSARTRLPTATQAWAKAQGFEATALTMLQVPAPSGGLDRVIVGAPGERDDPFALGAIVARLPEGHYEFADDANATQAVALGSASQGDLRRLEQI